MASLRCFSKDQIPRVWALYSANLKRACDRGDTDLNRVFGDLCKGTAQLWTYGESCVVTQIHEGKTKFCVLLLGAGKDMHEWTHYLPVVESWAKEQGCKTVRIYGRKGWAKVLGYQIDEYRMSKQL